MDAETKIQNLMSTPEGRRILVAIMRKPLRQSIAWHQARCDFTRLRHPEETNQERVAREAAAGASFDESRQLIKVFRLVTEKMTPEEREHPQPRPLPTRNARFAHRRAAIPPLLWGEGRGEGE